MFVRINVLSVEVALRVLVNHGCFSLTLVSVYPRKCQVGDLLALMENKKLATFPVIDSIESCKLIGTWRWCPGDNCYVVCAGVTFERTKRLTVPPAVVVVPAVMCQTAEWIVIHLGSPPPFHSWSATLSSDAAPYLFSQEASTRSVPVLIACRLFYLVRRQCVPARRVPVSEALLRQARPGGLCAPDDARGHQTGEVSARCMLRVRSG
jgi:hypothetical protein